MNKKIIYADDLMLAIRDDDQINGRNFSIMRSHINEAKSVDAVEVVHGRWESTGDPILDNIYGVAVCSICGYEYAGNNTPYCPNCGAKMDV